MEAQLVQEGKTINYTPAADVALGEIVDLGGMIGVATRAITASTLGALAIEGVFSVLKSGSAGPVFAAGDPVFWDTANSTAVRTGGSGCIYVGDCVEAAVTGRAYVVTRLVPHGLPAAMQDKLWEDVTLAGGSKTLDIEDCGKVLNVTVGHASNVITLPAVAAGLGFCIRCGASSQKVAVSPNSADKIMGADLAGVDNKDQILAAATSRMGDYIELDYGSADGWLIRSRRGVWAAEA